MTGNWLSQSLISSILLIPGWLAIGFLDRNYQIKPDVFLIWYFPCIVTFCILFRQAPLKTMIPSFGIICIILLIGFIGGVANKLIFRAVAIAPNPGLPLIFLNLTNIGVYLVAAPLSRWLPDYFNTVKIDVWTFFGVMLVTIGASIIAIRQ